MSQHDLDQMMSRLDETRRETLTMLQGIDLSRQVYPKPPWRGQDVIGHISLWEIEAAKSLQAHTQGREYVTEWPSDDEDAFNNAAADARRAWSITQIMDEFTSAREDMKAALRALPADKLTGIMMCQWGERGNVPFLIEEMIMHEIEHRDHIVKALHAP